MLQLPPEVLVALFEWLSFGQLLMCRQVCQLFNISIETHWIRRCRTMSDIIEMATLNKSATLSHGLILIYSPIQKQSGGFIRLQAWPLYKVGRLYQIRLCVQSLFRKLVDHQTILPYLGMSAFHCRLHGFWHERQGDTLQALADGCVLKTVGDGDIGMTEQESNYTPPHWQTIKKSEDGFVVMGEEPGIYLFNLDPCQPDTKPLICYLKKLVDRWKLLYHE